MKLHQVAIAALFVSCCAPVYAADMAVKAPPAPAAAPVSNWAGLYIGGYAGSAWVTDNIVDVNGLNGGAHYAIHADPALFGGQIGYNFQASMFVFGVEADYGVMGIHRKMFDPNFPGGTYSTLDSSDAWDLTGRVGFVVNNMFFFFKGGEAWSDMRAAVDNSAGGFGGGRAYTPDYFGPTYGGGVEWMFVPSWSVKADYQRYDFGTKNALLMTPFNGNFAYSNQININAVTVALDYHIPATGLCLFGHC